MTFNFDNQRPPNVHVGRATLVGNIDVYGPCWMLPGGGRVFKKEHAYAIAEKMDAIMERGQAWKDSQGF